MLIYLDETLHHQASRPFRMVGLSDHRFFDRYWFEALDPRRRRRHRRPRLLQEHGHVRRLRVDPARPPPAQPPAVPAARRRPRPHPVRPPRRHGDRAVPPSPPAARSQRPRMALDLEWRSDFPPYAEAHHLDVDHDRVTQDSTRYDQVGRWDGWVELDESGSKPTPGGGCATTRGAYAPVWAASSPRRAPSPVLWIWSCFSTDEWVCQFQLREDGDGNRPLLRRPARLSHG